MAKIFIALFSGINDDNNKQALPCFHDAFIQKLRDEGNELFVYISKVFAKNFENKPPTSVINKIKEFNPDLIILFNNAFWDISDKFDCPIAIYEVDSPLFYSNKESLKNNISRYKFIVPQEESIKILTEEFKAKPENIILAPFFTEVQSENIGYKNNIIFIGTKFTFAKSITPYKQFVNNHPTDEEKNDYLKLLTAYKENVFIEKDELLDKYNITSEKVRNCFKTNLIIFFLSDNNRIKTLSEVAELGLDIYGTPHFETDNYNEPGIIMSYRKDLIYSLKHNQDAYNSHKIGININHLQAKQGFSWRVCDIMASNACLVSEYKPDLDKYFSKINLPMFNNPYEARELCSKLLRNENMRQDIVCASNEIINKGYRFKHIKKLLEDFLNISLTTETITQPKYFVEERVIFKPRPKHRLYLYCYEKLKRKLERKGMV